MIHFNKFYTKFLYVGDLHKETHKTFDVEPTIFYSLNSFEVLDIKSKMILVKQSNKPFTTIKVEKNIPTKFSVGYIEQFNKKYAKEIMQLQRKYNLRNCEMLNYNQIAEIQRMYLQNLKNSYSTTISL